MWKRLAPLIARNFAVVSKPQVKLFTPGPLNTTMTVRQAVMYDFGSRDAEFGRIVEDVKSRLLKVAEVSPSDYTSIIVQGSGTFAVEATLGSCFPQLMEKDTSKMMLIIANGAYGERMVRICEYLKIPYHVLRYSDSENINPHDVKRILSEHPNITHVSTIHSETTSGVLNPIQEIGQVIHSFNPNITYVVDAMSSFGAVPINLYDSHITYLVSSSNKNLQGIPGFAFVIAKMDHFKNTQGNSRSLALDLYDQWKYQLNNPGQFRFTPPTHVIAAFYQALLEHEQEGGVRARGARYFQNQK